LDGEVAATRTSYDRLAGEYSARMFGELEHKPLDRELLDRLVERVGDLGPIGDLGCGPGHVARYLHERGAPVVGVDLSPGMIEQARRLSPGIEFRVGDMRALELPDGSWGGIACFYAIIHIPGDEIVAALGELRRVLRPGGWLLLTFHIGDEVRHFDELWGEPVDLDFRFFRTEEMVGYLRAAGFTLGETVEREPYSGVEVQTRRAYLFARQPDAGAP
jgi:SAM-dependent methyltransferase